MEAAKLMRIEAPPGYRYGSHIATRNGCVLMKEEALVPIVIVVDMALIGKTPLESSRVIQSLIIQATAEDVLLLYMVVMVQKERTEDTKLVIARLTKIGVFVKGPEPVEPAHRNARRGHRMINLG